MSFSQFLTEEKTKGQIIEIPKDSCDVILPTMDRSSNAVMDRQPKFGLNGSVQPHGNEVEPFNPSAFVWKRGEFVKIIRPPRQGSTNVRICDMYSGYFGEIKEIKWRSNMASVKLEACNNYQSIDISVDCLVRRDT